MSMQLFIINYYHNFSWFLNLFSWNTTAWWAWKQSSWPVAGGCWLYGRNMRRASIASSWSRGRAVVNFLLGTASLCEVLCDLSSVSYEVDQWLTSAVQHDARMADTLQCLPWLGTLRSPWLYWRRWEELLPAPLHCTDDATNGWLINQSSDYPLGRTQMSWRNEYEHFASNRLNISELFPTNFMSYRVERFFKLKFRNCRNSNRFSVR